MDQAERQKNECENCVYYLQHYVIHNSRLKPISCGHCINGKRTTRLIKCSCDFWEKKEHEKEFTDIKNLAGSKIENLIKLLKEFMLILEKE